MEIASRGFLGLGKPCFMFFIPNEIYWLWPYKYFLSKEEREKLVINLGLFSNFFNVHHEITYLTSEDTHDSTDDYYWGNPKQWQKLDFIETKYREFELKFTKRDKIGMDITFNDVEYSVEVEMFKSAILDYEIPLFLFNQSDIPDATAKIISEALKLELLRIDCPYSLLI